MNVHKLDRISAVMETGTNITACGITCTTYDRTQYMDMFGDVIRANKAWEGVTCRQCLKTNVNSASITVNPSA